MSTSVSETEEQVEKVPIRTIGKTLTQCGECKSNPSKYKCPGCSIQSCSLPCVKAHKLRTGCTGKRNQTQFVHISKFNDSILLSAPTRWIEGMSGVVVLCLTDTLDYNLLEEVKRVSEAASRMRSKLGMSTNFRLPHHLKSLQNAARSRRTKLQFLPNGMSKREKNQSQYDYRVDENTNFCSILEKHLKPGPWNHPLKEFCDDQLDCLKLFIRKYPKGPKSPFKELDMKAPIKQQLENVVILEYPVVFVFLPSHSIDFEVIKAVNPSIPKSPPNDSEIIPIPEGLLFREEVIEDDNNSDDPKVFDLMKQVESSSAHQVLTENNNSDEVLNDSLDISVFEGDVEGNLSPSSLLDRELNLFEDGTLAFDQDFMDDTFADLMRHLSSEEFLDFDSVFANNDENDIGLLAPIEEFPVPEELEEGEIQE
ncbi:box C/D snoRNA protein 1 [Trifolium pratense]|uniref:Box C/D snoRNA protein 1 n=2 Tax=Trifolium pratense TaxID=57577 RepID=A0A2K3NBP0_TRIPR|nr:box C/D snoRNA protein 1 [Trifolium pratense]